MAQKRKQKRWGKKLEQEETRCKKKLKVWKEKNEGAEREKKMRENYRKGTDFGLNNYL